MTTDANDLVEVVVSVRDEIAPDADVEFLRAVVAAEEAHPDDGTAAVREIEAVLAISLARGDAG
jgi:hypothetical protein